MTAGLVLTLSSVLSQIAAASPQTPVFSYSGAVPAAGQSVPTGRRVAINSAGNAVVASQESYSVERAGTELTWVTKNGEVIASAHVDAVNPLDLTLDAQDDVYVSGYLPQYRTIDTGNAFDGCRSESLDSRRAVVVKVSAATKQVTMAACLVPGYGNSVKVDRAGVVYVAGTALSGGLPTSPNALKSRGDGNDGFLVKLDSGGKLLYSTYIGGPGSDSIAAIAVGDDNSVYLTGTTDSFSLGTPGSFRQDRIGSVLYRSLDHGGTWHATGRGLPWTGVHLVARQPSSANILYAIASSIDPDAKVGLYRSGDGGDNWVYVGLDPGHSGYPPEVAALLISPDSTLYVAYTNALYRSVDGGASWKRTAMPTESWSRLQVAADGALYLSTTVNLALRSRDSGESWQIVFAAKQFVDTLAVSPRDPTRLFLMADFRIYRSDDSGEKWTDLLPWRLGVHLAISPSNPAILYRVEAARLDRSEDGGSTWTQYTRFQTPDENIFLDASSPDIVYSVAAWNNAVWRLSGHDQEFVNVSMPLAGGPVYGLVSSTNRPGEILLATEAGLDAFVMKMTSGNRVSYFSYVGGYGLDYPTAIAVDSAGNTYIAGFTTSQNFDVTAGAYRESFNGGDFVTPALQPAGALSDTTAAPTDSLRRSTRMDRI